MMTTMMTRMTMITRSIVTFTLPHPHHRWHFAPRIDRPDILTDIDSPAVTTAATAPVKQANRQSDNRKTGRPDNVTFQF